MNGTRGIGVVAAALGVHLAGCATPPMLDDTYVRATYIRQRCLPGVEVDKTTRAEILTEFGPPTASLSDGRVLAYRLLLADSTVAPMTVNEYQHRMGRAFAALPRALGPDPLRVWRSRDSYPGGTSEHNYRRRSLAESCTLVTVTPSVAEERTFDLVGREAEYGLVLAFDDGGLLRDLSFRRIWP